VFDHGTAICGPVDWKNVSAHCVENNRSPINIKTDEISVPIFLYPNGYLFMVGSVSGVLVNSGHAPTLIVLTNPKLAPYLLGVPGKT